MRMEEESIFEMDRNRGKGNLCDVHRAFSWSFALWRTGFILRELIECFITENSEQS